MKKLILALIALSVQGLFGQPEKRLQIGFGSGIYTQDHAIGPNISLSMDYRINSSFTLSQFNQFAFISPRLQNFKLAAVNQHFGFLLMRHVYSSKSFNVLVGAGVSSSKYHDIRLRTIYAESDRSNIYGSSAEISSRYELSFPLQLELTKSLSDNISFGARFGAHVPTHGGILNYAFFNPVLKFRL